MVLLWVGVRVWAVIRVNIHILWSCCLGGRLGAHVGTRTVQIWDTDTQGEGTGDSPCPFRPLQGWVGG